MFPGRLVTELIEEEQRLPVDTLDLMMEYGAYAQTFAAMEHADRTGVPQKQRPTGEMADLCRQIEVELVMEKYASG